MLLVLCLLLADEIHLKSGGRLEGKIVRETDDEIEIRTSAGASVTIKRAEIQRIDYRETPEEEIERRRAALAADDVAGIAALGDEAARLRLTALAVRLYREAGARDRLLPLIEPDARSALERARTPGPLEALIEAYPETESAETAHVRLGRLHLDADNVGDAERWFRRLYESHPGHPEALKGLIAVFTRLEDWETVGRLVEDASLDEEHRALGRRAIELGRRRERLSAEEMAEWARICFAFGATQSGLARIEEAHRLDPKDAEIAGRLSDLYADLGRLRDALAVLRKAGADKKLEALSWRVRYPGEWDAAALARVEPLVNRALDGEAVDLAAVDRALVEAAARFGRRFEAEPDAGKVIKRRVRAEASPEDDPNREIEYLVRPPRGYDPLLRYPLLVGLHGAHGRGEFEVALWEREIERREDVILLCPSSDRYGWGSSAWGHANVVTPIHEVMNRYNIDPDRVYVGGESMGGGGSFETVCHSPGLAAAISPRIGTFRILVTEDPRTGVESRRPMNVENLRNTPVYWIAGAKDEKVPIDMVRVGVNRMKALDLDLIYKEYPDGGHEWFPEENDPVLDWFATKTRPRYPRDVEIYSDDPIITRSWWVEIVERDGAEVGVTPHVDMDGKLVEERPKFKPAAHVEARALDEKNGIRITAKGVRKLRVYLHDELVDFARPITVTVNGKAQVYKDVKPDAGFLVGEARRTGDRSRLYWAALDVDVR